MTTTRHFLNHIQEWNGKAALSILGATGSGKTSLLLDYLRNKKFAKEDLLLVSLDSVAAYTELNIGSAKVHGADRSDFDWIGLDLVTVDKPMNAALFRDAVLPTIQSAQKQNKKIIFAGGSHFYERFLVEGAAPGEASDAEFLESQKIRGAQAVRDELLSRDQRFEWIHPNDSYRIFRYADLVLRQNLGYDELQTSVGALVSAVDTLVIDVDPAELDKRLAARIRKMLQDGWVPETKTLLDHYGPDVPGLQTIGYFEIKESLVGKISPAELEEKILTRHHQLAKQQRSWLRSMRTGS